VTVGTRGRDSRGSALLAVTGLSGILGAQKLTFPSVTSLGRRLGETIQVPR